MTEDLLSIGAVERDTGLTKDTLRIWERRYGFPQPLRDAVGERAYPPEQVAKLRQLKRLTDVGYRPGKLAGMPLDELQLLGQGPADFPVGDGRPQLDADYRRLLHDHDLLGLRRQLHQALLAFGPERFVIEHVAPLNEAVGNGWMRGELTVAQEHLYTEALQLVLRQAIGRVPEPPANAPRVLLATLPQEGHGLGLLMCEMLFVLHGCRCTSLGVRVPMDSLVAAANVTQAAIVGVGFSGSFNARQALAAIHDLRQLLPPDVALWAGGRNLALQRRLPPGALAVPDIGLVSSLLKDKWSPLVHIVE